MFEDEDEMAYAEDNPPSENDADADIEQPGSASKKKSTTILDHFSKVSSTASTSSSGDDVIEVESNNNNKTEVKSGCQLTQEEQQMVDSSGSLVWFYFTKEGKEFARCKTCSAPRSTPTGTTKTLMNHLKIHRKEFAQYEKLDRARKSTMKKRVEEKKEDSSNKLGVATLKGRCGTLPSTSKRSQDLTKAISYWIAKGLHAYSEVNEPGFRYLMWKAEPRYVVPHRTTFSRGVIPKLFRTDKEKQLSFLNSIWDFIDSVTITTHSWTSRAQDSFLASTLQFIINNEEQDVFELRHLTLDLIPFPGSHTSERICEAAYKMLTDINIKTDEVEVFIVADNASNMVAAFEEPGLQKSLDLRVPLILRESKPWTHLKCVDHTLQLAISDSRKEIGANTVIDKVIVIVNRYSWSKIAREKLQKKQEESGTVQHELVKNVVTRWNSEFLMLQRFLEQKVPISLELLEAGVENLTAQQWKMVEGYIEVLKPIASFTADLGSTKQPTLSMVIPVLYEIRNSLEDFIRKPSNKGSGVLFARSLLKHVNERFPDSDYKDNPVYQVPTLLDPRFKDLLMDEHVAVNLLEKAALEKYRRNIRRGRVKATSTTEATQEELRTSEPEPLAKKSKWGHLQKIQRNVDPETLDVKNIIAHEVRTFLAMAPVDAEKGDAVLWWRSNRKTFPHLIDLAAEQLAIAATEVYSERDFSIGSNTVTPKRTNLATEHVREIVFLFRNLVIPAIPDVCSSSLFHSSDQ